MKETIELSILLTAEPKTIYEAWLNSELHTEMTGGEAQCSSIEGESFSTWDGYITGANIKLNEYSEIEQTWRTSEFSETDEDSHLIIRFNPHKNGTELVLIHTNIPEGQTQYIQGWKEFYFEPMTAYFKDKSE